MHKIYLVQVHNDDPTAYVWDGESVIYNQIRKIMPDDKFEVKVVDLYNFAYILDLRNLRK